MTQSAMSPLLKKLLAHRASTRFAWLIGAVVCVSAWYVIFSPSSFSFIALLVLLFAAPLSFRYPRETFLALFVVRSALDIFGGIIIIPFPVPLNISSVLGIALAGWGLWYALTRNIIFPKLQTALFSLVGIIALFSALQSIDVVATVEELIKYINLGLLFIIAYDFVKDIHNYRVLLKALAAAIIIPALVGYYQLFTHSGIAGSVSDRILGTFGHPNSFGFALVLSIGLLLILQTQILKYRKAFLWALIALIPLLLGTYTRGAWIGACIVGALYGIRFIPKQTIGILMLVSIAAFMLFKTPSRFPAFVSEIPLIQRITLRDEETSSLEWRRRVWFEMKGTLAQTPLFGYGFGNFTALRRTTVTYETDLLALEAHNDYLRLAIELGYIGLVFYLLVYISVVVQMMRAAFITRFVALQRAFVVVASLNIAFLIMAIADNVLQSTTVNWILYALMGGALSLATSVLNPRDPQ